MAASGQDENGQWFYGEKPAHLADDLPPEMHRGVGMRLPQELHDHLRDESVPAADRAQALLDHLDEHSAKQARYGGGGIGIHWSVKEKSALGFATRYDQRNHKPMDFVHDPLVTRIVFHAQTADPAQMLRSKRKLDEHSIFGINHGEGEIPLKKRSRVHLNGISWGENAKDAPLTRFDFPQQIRRTAGIHADPEPEEDGMFRTAGLLGHFEAVNQEGGEQPVIPASRLPKIKLDYTDKGGAEQFFDHLMTPGVVGNPDATPFEHRPVRGWDDDYQPGLHRKLEKEQERHIQRDLEGKPQPENKGEQTNYVLRPGASHEEIGRMADDLAGRLDFTDQYRSEIEHGLADRMRAPHQNHYKTFEAHPMGGDREAFLRDRWQLAAFPYSTEGRPGAGWTSQSHPGAARPSKKWVRKTWTRLIGPPACEHESCPPWQHREPREAALLDHFEGAARPGRGEKTCTCCKGSGSHGDGTDCTACSGNGTLGKDDPGTRCPGQPQPKRRHWREKTAMPEGYGYEHRALESAAPFHAADKSLPNVYDHPRHYAGSDTDNHREAVGQLMGARGKPEQPVRVYRAMPFKGGGRINTGDWVATASPYAHNLAEDRNYHDPDSLMLDPKTPEERFHVYHADVPAGELRNGGNDILEWGYYGSGIQGTHSPDCCPDHEAALKDPAQVRDETSNDYKEPILGHFEAAGVDDYGMGHRPLHDGAPAHDLHEGYAEDIYTHPHYWAANWPDKASAEGLKQLRDARGNPEHPVTIYRASPPGAPYRMHTGDWVSLSPTYAELHAYHEGDDEWHVHKAVVPAKHVRDAGTDQYREQGYWGPDIDTEHYSGPRPVTASAHQAAGPDDYGILHRPDVGGPPLHDLTDSSGTDWGMPKDIYERMHEYNTYQHDPGLLGEAAWKAMGKIRKFRGEPEKKVRIWRAAPAVNPESRNAKRGEINHGDWIGLSREKALSESYEVNDPPHGSLPANHPQRYHIWSALVPAKHVRNADGDLTEWGYAGPDIKDIPHYSETCSHRARVQPREAAVHEAELSDDDIHAGLGLPTAEEGHKDVQKEHLENFKNKFDKLFLGDDADWEDYRLNKSNENMMDLRRRYEGGSGTFGFNHNEDDEPGSPTGSPYYEIKHRDERGNPTGWRIRHYNDGPMAEIEHEGTPGDSHETIELPRQEYASNTPHEWFGHEHLHKMLHAWHAGVLDPDEPDENRKYLEENEPGIRRWRRRMGRTAAHDVVAHFEDPEQRPFTAAAQEGGDEALPPKKAGRQREGDERPYGSYTMRYSTEDHGERKPRHVIETFHQDGSRVGRLSWYGTTGTVFRIETAGEEDNGREPFSPNWGNGQEHRRRGIATAMWDWSQEMTPKAKHSGDQTNYGKLWSKSLSGPRKQPPEDDAQGLGEVEAAAGPGVTVEHQQGQSGGSTYPHLHTITATHPDGTTAELRYMLSKRGSRGVVDGAFIPKDYAESLGVPLVREARRLHPQAFVKGLPGVDEDWGRHLPSVTSLHRNLTVKLDPADREYMHDESVPKAHRARFLMDLMARSGPSMHWASQRGRAAAEQSFGDHEFRSPEHTQIALNAQPPAPEHVETDPERISKNGGYAYQAPDWEVPLKEGAPVAVNSVRWRTGGSGWTHHQFKGGHQFTAGQVTAAEEPEYGPKPKWESYPEDASDEERSANFERQNKIKHAWESHVLHGMSTGRLHPDKAKELGYYFDGHQTDRWGDHTWKPLPQHLWHVTTDLPGVREHGLKTRQELAQMRGHGLGGGPDDMISLTDSHQTAQGILRAVHEFHHVVNGRYTPQQMWEDAKAGRGASRPFHEDLASYYRSGWKDGDPHPRGLDSALRNVETKAGGLVYSPQEMTEHYGPGWRPHPHESDELRGGDGVARYNVWERDMDPDRRRENAADFYKNFAEYRQHAGGPENPTFFSTDTKAFAAKDPGHFAIMHVAPRPGAMGHQVSALGEWRTGTGDALETHRAERLEGGHLKEASLKALGATDWDQAYDSLPAEIHRGLYAPESHQAFSMPMSDEEIAHTLIAAHQDEQFPHDRDRDKLFGTHWSASEDVAREFAHEHERAHHDEFEGEDHDHDEHSEATPVVFHAQRPERHEIEDDPRRLGWQNVEDHDHHEQEVPIRHGAPVRLTGVSWLKHTGMGPIWHRHDLREPVKLRAEDRDSPDDPDQWNGEPPGHPKEASMLGARYEPGLPNPHTGGGEWFHGTQAHPGDFVHGFSHDESHDHDWEEMRGKLAHWNTLLGSHFAADHGVAAHFARNGSSVHDPEDESEDDLRSRYETYDAAPHSSVLHAKLHLRNPKVYGSEFDMDHEAYEHEYGERKNYISKHFEDGYEHEDPHSEDYDPDTPGDMEEWPLAARYRHDDKQPIDREQMAPHVNPDSPDTPERVRWLNSHPDKGGIARRFKERLTAQGHDGILYGNEFESHHAEGHGKHRGMSAIIFRPEQAEITQHHQCDGRCLSPEEAEHQRRTMPQPHQEELPGVEEHADDFPRGFLRGSSLIAHFEEPKMGAGPYYQEKLFHQQRDNTLHAEDSMRHNPADPMAGVRYRQEHEEGYEQPPETWDDPVKGNRDEESGLYRHPGHGGYHCHACTQYNGEPAFHDDAETAEHHSTAWTDWDEEYPHIPETVHRGLWLGGGGRHLDGLTGTEAAEKILHLARPFGTHWTGNEAQARHYSGIGTTGPDRSGENVNAVIHARKPVREDIEDNPETLADRGVYGIGYHEDEEIPLREHAPVHVLGVSWRRGSDPRGEWQHHEFPQPAEHTAAREEQRRNMADIGQSMLAYDKDMHPDDRAFLQSAIDHIRRGAPASEPLDAGDAEHMARGMRARDRMEQAGWQLAPGQDKIRYPRGFTIDVGEHHRATLNPNTPSGWHVRTYPAEDPTSASHIHHDLDVRDEDLPAELHKYYGSEQIKGQIAAQRAEWMANQNGESEVEYLRRTNPYWKQGTAQGDGHTAALASSMGVVAHFMDGEDHPPIPEWGGGKLFHGTRSILHPGEMLTADEAVRHQSHPDENSEGYVHATPVGDEAQYWAEHADPYTTHSRMEEMGRGRTFSYARGENQGHAYPPRVYEVEPSGHMEPDPNGEGSSYRSAHPMRVVREVRPLDCYDCPDSERTERHWPDHQHYDYLLRQQEEDDEDRNERHEAALMPGPDQRSAAEERGDRWHEYKNNNDHLHRGIHIELPEDLHSYVHDESQPREERARALQQHFADSGEGLGMHWTPHVDIANRSIGNAADAGHGLSGGRLYRGGDATTDVMFHATTGQRNRLPEREHDQYDIGWKYSPDEDEFPVKPGSPMKLHGISWKEHDQEHPFTPFEHVDFAKPMRHISSALPAVVAHFGEDRDEAVSDHRAQPAHMLSPGDVAYHLSQYHGFSPGDLPDDSAETAVGSDDPFEQMHAGDHSRTAAVTAHFDDDDEDDFDEEPERHLEPAGEERDEDDFVHPMVRDPESGERFPHPDQEPRCLNCGRAAGYEVRHRPEDGHSVAGVQQRIDRQREQEGRWDRGEYDRTRYCGVQCEMSHAEDRAHGIGVHHTFGEGEPEHEQTRLLHGEMPQLSGPFEEPAGRSSGSYEVRNPSAEHRCHYCRNILPQYRKEASVTAAYDWETDEGPFTWQEIAQRHPRVYGDDEDHVPGMGEGGGHDIADMAAELYHDRPSHPYAQTTGELHPENDDQMEFHPRTVDVNRIDYMRVDRSERDPRVERARKGFEDHRQREKIPPLILVHRHGVYHVADGSHRGNGAEQAHWPSVRAYVAYSPHENEPFAGRDGEPPRSGPFHGAEKENRPPMPDQNGVRRPISFPGFPHTTERPRPETGHTTASKIRYIPVYDRAVLPGSSFAGLEDMTAEDARELAAGFSHLMEALYEGLLRVARTVEEELPVDPAIPELIRDMAASCALAERETRHRPVAPEASWEEPGHPNL